MSEVRRSTIYLDADLHQALRLKAAATDVSVSDLVNDAVRMALVEDQEDLAAFEERADAMTSRRYDVWAPPSRCSVTRSPCRRRGGGQASPRE